MPTKTPWPDPFSGFTEGFTGGMKMGLLRRQQNLAEQESLAKAAEAEAKAKREDIAAKFAAAKELQGVRHPAIQKARLNMYATTVKKNAEYFGIDPSAIPDNIEWNDDFTIPLKELDSAFEAWKEGKISDSQGLQALRETMTKMGGVMDSADVEKLRAEKEKQFGEMQQTKALTGASDISTRMRMNPDLVAQTDPAVLEGIESEKNRLMVEGGATPEQMLFKGAEGKALTPSWKIISDTTSPTGFSYQNLNNPQDIRKGAPKPRAGAEVNVSLGGLSKTSQTKLEEDIMGADTKIEAFDEIEKLSNPAYLTYKGEAIAGAQKYAEKFGIPVDTKFLQERTEWKQQAMSAFLEWRKWITGVAGGGEELKQIAKSFPDPEKNSPTEFKANLEQARRWTKKLRNRWIILRSLGIDKPTKEDLARFPLEHIPEILPKQLQQPQQPQGNVKVNIDDLSDDELLNILGGE